MHYENPEDLAKELGASVDFVTATVGLDEGVLSRSSTHLYFLAQRMGGWEVVEETPISQVNRVDSVENFLGTTMVIVTQNGRWTCRDVLEDIDLSTWLGQSSGTSNIARDKAIRSMKAKLESQKKTSENRKSDESKSTQIDFEELEKAKPMDITRPQPLKSESNRPTQTQQPTESQDLTQLLGEMEIESDDAEGSGCGKTFLKFFIFIWVIGFFGDMCN